MSLLHKATKGKVKRNEFIVLFSPEGCGKTSFIAEAPNPLIIDIEKGSLSLNVTRITDIDSFEDVMRILLELKTEKHDFKTLGVDTLDHLEFLVIASVLKDTGASSITDQTKLPYGKGYELCLEKWKQFIEACEALRDKMHVILASHTQIKTVTDPTKVANYDRFELKLNKKAAAYIKEKVDAVLFANYEVHVKTDRPGQKGKAFGEGKRVLFTHGMPGHEGKSRVNLPYELPLSFTAYMEAKEKADTLNPDAIKKSIEANLTLLADGEMKAKATEAFKKAGNDFEALLKVNNRLEVVLSQ